jgi:tetratricopeptide (TPR) repeat protein
MALNPKNSASYNNIAWLYATQRKNLGEALELAQKALELTPNDSNILDTLGFVYYQQGEYQRAEPVLKRAADLAAGNASIFYHLGMTYYKLGRRDDAASALRRSLQLQETIPQAAEIRAVLDDLKK